MDIRDSVTANMPVVIDGRSVKLETIQYVYDEVVGRAYIVRTKLNVRI